MNFISHSSAQSGFTTSIASELNLIGCEAWIDLGRFCAGENSMHPIAGDLTASGDYSDFASTHASLTKSFALFRKKLRRASTKSQD